MTSKADTLAQTLVGYFGLVVIAMVLIYATTHKTDNIAISTVLLA
jgi:hypothetical protein